MYSTDTICVYFYRFGQPLQQMIDGNHFGYMQSIIQNDFNRTVSAGLSEQG